MILNFFIAIMKFFIDGIANILPSYTLFPTSLSSQIATFMGYINGWSWLIPVPTIVAILGILIVLVFVEFTYFVAMYVLGVIHSTIRG